MRRYAYFNSSNIYAGSHLSTFASSRPTLSGFGRHGSFCSSTVRIDNVHGSSQYVIPPAASMGAGRASASATPSSEMRSSPCLQSCHVSLIRPAFSQSRVASSLRGADQVLHESLRPIATQGSRESMTCSSVNVRPSSLFQSACIASSSVTVHEARHDDTSRSVRTSHPRHVFGLSEVGRGSSHNTPQVIRLADLLRPAASSRVVQNEHGKCPSYAPPPSEMQEPGRQSKITDFFQVDNASNSGLLYAPSSGFSSRVGPPPRGMAGVSSVSDSCQAWISGTPDDNEGPKNTSQLRNPRSERRRLRRQAYRCWKSSVLGGESRGLDSLGLSFSRKGSWQPSKPPTGASRSSVRLAISGQSSVLRSAELWERGRWITPPSVTQLGSRVSNRYIQKERTTLVRSELFRRRVLDPLPPEVPKRKIKTSPCKLP